MPEVDVNGVTVDAHGLEEALDAYESSGETSYGPGVMIFDDGDNDDAVYVANANTNEVTTSFSYPDGLRERINEALGDEPFVEYVRHIDGLSGGNTVEERDGDGYDVVVSYDGLFSGSEIRSLVEDDGVRFGKVKGEDGGTTIYLNDDR